MKRMAGILLLVLGSALLMYAQNSREMRGTICDAECVSQVANQATCDTSCTAKTGMAVFVADDGTVHEIANQSICKSHMGKHVKIMADPVKPATENQREQWLRIQTIENEHAPNG
jgi:hypothetical protein